MSRLFGIRFSFLAVVLFVAHVSAQKLPEGQYHVNRERSYDILHYKAELAFDFASKGVSGTATVQLSPLRTIDAFALDAILLNIKRVRIAESNIDLRFEQKDNKLHIALPSEITHQDKLTVVVQYEATPTAGMYFVPDPENAELFYVTTYGEDGLHANWLPIYSGVNDKFTTKMVVTVPEPYVVIANGKLVEKKALAGGETRFHYLQEQPHPNYLIALYVGNFEEGKLEPAFGSIPLSYWVPKGRLQEGAFAFRNTTRMVEYFSERFDYRYPWVKYDQIAVPEYAIGAMEHTGVTGHRASILRTGSAPLDFSPTLEHYADPWSVEAIIAHELAHHWFGNLVTCRNLSYIWLNESFASYLMMLWDEEALGKDQLLFAVDLAKQQYLDYVRREHIIRPLEYHYFDSSNDIYNTEHTYYKGAVVLHMLRTMLGDEPFFRGLSYYLKKHEFANVESHDLKIAFEEATGKNLHWFFQQWVTGGGHPQFEVSYRYLPQQQKIALRVKQVQPLVEGQGLFTLPVNITIATPARTWRGTIWVKDAEETFYFHSGQRPLMVSFDGDGDLVAEIDFDKDAAQWAYQALNDAVPGRLRAIRQLTAQFPTSDKTIETLRKVLTSGEFWATQAEAALQLGTVRSAPAEALANLALKSDDYRVRKAAVLALGKFATAAVEKLREIVRSDPHDDVVATAILALAKATPDLSVAFIQKQLERPSWYDEIRVATLKACAQLGDSTLVPIIRDYSDPKYNQSVEGAALTAWRACAPLDEELHQTLIARTESPVYAIQQDAIRMLGELAVVEASARLEHIVEQNADRNLVVAAKKALERIRAVASN